MCAISAANKANDNGTWIYSQISIIAWYCMSRATFVARLFLRDIRSISLRIASPCLSSARAARKSTIANIVGISAVFDDRFYFVENPGVHVTTHHLALMIDN